MLHVKVAAAHRTSFLQPSFLSAALAYRSWLYYSTDLVPAARVVSVRGSVGEREANMKERNTNAAEQAARLSC